MEQNAGPQPTQGNGFYTPTQPVFDNTPNPDVQTPPIPRPAIEWEASEYVQHEKSTGWLILVALVTIIATAVALFFQQWIFAVLIVVMGVAFGVFGVRKPHTIHYKLSDDGLIIGERTYHFADFRAFGVRADGAFYSAIFFPVKRLAPGINIYFSEAEGQQILDIIEQHLPLEKLPPDPVENIMRKLRF